ncbi:6-bladed beta-propeller [Mucilaginibacter sp. UYCu711]|uniref:6-bladed beta-propeller n=1 Tax=Mucilaginibacter sp. UYCu711 TaxID=3156339 RepID=UPI003D21D7EE
MNEKHEAGVTIRVPGILSAMRKNSLVKNFRMLKLETTPECLIGNIEQLYQIDSYIFIFDRNNYSILKFDNQGHFLKRIGRRGQGPAEYINLVDVDLNKSNKTLSALDLDGRKIITYDFEGNVVSQKKIPFLFNAYKFKNNQVYLNTCLFTNVANPAVDLNQLIVSDTAFNPQLKSFAYSTALRKSEFIKTAQLPFRDYNNQLYYFNTLSPDTIWNLNKDTKSPAYVLSFSKKYFQDLDQLEISKMVMEKKNQSFNGHYYISKDFACFGITEKSNYIYPLLYSISTGHIMYGGITGDSNLPGIPPQRLINLIGDASPTFALENGDFCKVWQPFDLKGIIGSWNDKTKKLLYGPDKKFIDDLSEDDNPVLFLYNFEKF